MNKYAKITLFFFISVILLSCESETCFYGAGKDSQRILDSSAFKKIHVYGILDIELVQDSCYYVEGFGGKNILEHLDISVRNDTLVIYNNNSCFWLREYIRPKISIHYADISALDMHETCYVFSTDSITDNFRITSQCMLAEINLVFNNSDIFFYVHHFTGGKYTFRGKTENLYIDGYYSSIVDASELVSKVATIKNHSIADFSVWTTDVLNVELYNTGNIFYKGTPVINIDTLVSSGKLLPLQ